jgi:pyridine nucleotide-disulfide oxidoreductase
MSEHIDAAIVGAGPYGLSLAAHLRARGVSFRIFGTPMGLWRTCMPRGMYLKSPGFGSSLSSPDGGHTLEAFCASAGLPFAPYGLQMPLSTFADYGLWFARDLVPGVEDIQVTGLSRRDAGFDLVLDGGESVRAGHVVVATGVEHFGVVPDQLAGLPAPACLHSSALTEPADFAGRSVLVLGAGQSALESAALLHENGASVQLVARRRELAWNEPWPPVKRPLPARLRTPASGLGTGYPILAYARYPELFRHRPSATRTDLALSVLGPAGADWLADRVTGQFPVRTGQNLSWAKPDGEGVRLGFDGADGTSGELYADHVIAATGYRTDLRRLTFLDQGLRESLRTLAGTPVVNRGYESSVPGLSFIGPAVAPTFGPVMRFVCGAGFPARAVSRRLARVCGRRGG